MQPYNFKVELEALRERIQAEHSLDVKGLKPNYQTIRPLMIMFSEFFRLFPWVKRSSKETKELRLKMLSLWVQSPVESTYDLTVYQVSTILDFTEYREFGIGPRTKRFLEDCQASVEGRDIPGEDEFSALRNDTGTPVIAD